MLAGAALGVAAPDGHRDPGYLVDLIRRESVTTVHFVPSMLDMFLAAGGVAERTSLRRVFSSGEALPAETVARDPRQPAAPLHNRYGPTEAAGDLTHRATELAPDPD